MGIGDALDLCNSFLSICLGYLSEVLFSLKTEAMKSGLISNKGRQACLLQACIPSGDRTGEWRIWASSGCESQKKKKIE